MSIDEIVEFENEHTGLDFKATQYRKETYPELLKDIIAMANAFVEGDRRIIVGVKKSPDGIFTIQPITEQFADSATYQQLVLDNIEPDIHVDYEPHLYKGSQLIGILTIKTGTDKPYMMKKDYTSRKKGESFVRKGTTTFPLLRKDVDRIFLQKKQEAESKNKPAFKLLFNGEEKIELSLPKNFTTYKALSKAPKNYPEYLNYLAHKYYTTENVNNFNFWFEANPEKVEEYNNIVTGVERSKQHNKLYKIAIANIGKIKANDIKVKISFLDGLFIFDESGMSDFKKFEWSYPEGAPFHPLVRALTAHENRKNGSASKAERSPYGVNTVGFSQLRSIHATSSFEVVEHRYIDIMLKSLLHTDVFEHGDFQFILAPTKAGGFIARVEIICEELPDKQIIEVPVIITETD